MDNIILKIPGKLVSVQCRNKVTDVQFYSSLKGSPMTFQFQQLEFSVLKLHGPIGGCVECFSVLTVFICENEALMLDGVGEVAPNAISRETVC